MTVTAPKRTADGLSIRPAVAEDVPAIVDLVRTALGEGSIPRSQEFWRWKHEQNPFGRSPVLLAEQTGRIVGLRAFMRWTFRTRKGDVRAVRAVDTATHPDARGRGIFRRLTLALADAMAADGVAFVFNTPNAQSMPGYVKMGWRAVGRPVVWIRANRPSRLAKGLLGWRAADTAPDGRLCGEAVQRLIEWSGLDRLLDSDRTVVGGLATPVTVGYLTWRYAEVPGFEYRMMVEEVGESAAAAIFRVKNRANVTEARICELFASQTADGGKAVRRLLNRIAHAGHDFISLKPRDSRTARNALACGFAPVPRLGPVLTVRELSAAAERHRVNDWRFSIGDLELF